MKESLIYLDNAATSFPKPDVVIEAVVHTLKNVGGNPGRSGHSMSMAANRTVFQARENLATLLGVKDSSRLIFTSGATESLNLAIKGLVNTGDHVITSVFEHNSVTRPIHSLSKKGVEVTKVSCDAEGYLSLEVLKSTIKKNTSLVVVSHASNVLGTIEPIQELCQICKENDVPILLDASQTAGLIPIDVESLGVDLLAAPGHKGLMGPQGTGILYIAENIKLKPLIEGGTGGGPSGDEQPMALPERYEAGTMNMPGIAGLGTAAVFILNEGIENIRQKEKLLLQKLIDGLEKIDGVIIYGSHDAGKRVSLVSFNIKGIDPDMVAFTLDENFDIMVRSGLHCAPDTHRFLKTYPSGCLRISPAYFNEEGEIDSVLKAIREIAQC